ncbi:hypothetical protein [Fulvivirga sedimenti]|uniref:YceI family protein n=1 Tax=Fulvivirga sedimenti TaxID=2879465 RepID=A0A9X1HKC3_9BACT|nr:hypothetical protein [Fulvivirga sedimenti]MCA6073794.1 hypothetical protein [Fulvivirga sedimenti]
MKTFLFIVVLSLAGACAFCQKTVSIMVDPASSLNIHGKTNINKFLCAQCETLDKDTVEITMTNEDKVVHLTNASLKIRVKDFDCGINQMTREFRELLQADDHPYLRMILETIEPIGDGKFIANIAIVLAGVKSGYRIPVEVHDDERTLICSGKSQVSFVDFNLEPPVKFMGMVKVNEMLDISFNLIIRKII